MAASYSFGGMSVNGFWTTDLRVNPDMHRAIKVMMKDTGDSAKQFKIKNSQSMRKTLTA